MRGLFLAVVAVGLALSGCVGESTDEDEAVGSASEELVHDVPRTGDGGGLRTLEVLDDDAAEEEEAAPGFSGPGDNYSEPVPHPWVPKTKNAGVRDNDA